MASRGKVARHQPAYAQQRRGPRLSDPPQRHPAAPSGLPVEVLLAFDYGARRIGVAVGQTSTNSANAAGTLAVHAGKPDWNAVLACIAKWAPARLLVGLPYNMDGSETTTTAPCRAFGEELSRRCGLPVEFVDERLTSNAAYDELRDARRSGVRARRIRREDIDANAARLILETWLQGRES